MKFFFSAFIFLALNFSVHAQITGSDTVCAGYLYNFSANIAGADSFAWSMPTGWAIISGEGTSLVEMLCTQNTGQVCVDGFDTSGNFIAQYCHPVYWGNGGTGWDVTISFAWLCQCPPMTASIVPNVSGGSCGACGSGTPDPNLAYVIYDAPYPNGNFFNLADGVSQFSYPFGNQVTYYVYLMDVTFGISDAILIDGGNCAGTNNNTFTLSPCNYVNLGITSTPDTVCLGDTLLLQYDGAFGSFNSYSWHVNQGNVLLLPPNGFDYIECLVLSPSTSEIWLTAWDFNGCPYHGTFFPNTINCSMQLTGDSVVCAGNTYTYMTNMPGAVSYNWTVPAGWYDMTGQGTQVMTVNCNVNTGAVCVEGFDSSMNSVGFECINTQWGNGGSAGWDVVPSSVNFCLQNPYPDTQFSIQPNGSGGGSCPQGCGNGILSADILYGVYDDAFPNQHFVGAADGSAIYLPATTLTFYVYHVDTTAGADFPDAVIVEGGCGSVVINNTVSMIPNSPNYPTFIQSPDTICLGDTVLLTQTNPNLVSLGWQPPPGITILSYPSQNQVLLVVHTLISPFVMCEGYDINNGCHYQGSALIAVVPCVPVVAGFSSVVNPVCPGACTDFTNLSTGSVSYHWSFPGATPPASSAANPSNICYNTPGTYDVMLVASNGLTNDTLLVPNYITVLPYPPPQSIIQSGDSLIANQGFVSYQWYYNGSKVRQIIFTWQHKQEIITSSPQMQTDAKWKLLFSMSLPALSSGVRV